MKVLKTLGKIALALVGGLVALFVLLYVLTIGEYAVAETVAEDASIPHVTIDGVTFHAETFGDPASPAVIVVHGGPGGDYRSLLSLQALSDQYYVVFYDQRGSGLSPRVDPEEITLASSLADLDAVVDHYGSGSKVNLVGHSWGAMLASAYLGQHPEKVDHAVLAEPGFLTSEFAARWSEATRMRFSPRVLYHLIKTKFEALHVRGPDEHAADDYFGYQMNMYQGDDHPQAGYRCEGGGPQAGESWRYGARGADHIVQGALDEEGNLDVNLVDGVQAFTNEILFMASECQSIIGADWQREQMAFFSRAELVVISGAGHEMFAENPQESIAAVRAYLNAPAETASAPAEDNALWGSEWELLSLNGADPIEGKAITLRFGETSLEGSGGCNTYGGSYTASEGSLRLSDLYWTEMACMEPQGIMEQEQAYFEALNTATRYQTDRTPVDGDRLELYDEAGRQILVFVAAGGLRSASVTPTPESPTATAVVSATPVVPEPPPGFKQIVDAASGVSLWVPGSWTIVEPGPHGGPTILQSFPMDKYVGGEPFQAGDTKCDLTVHPTGTTVADVAPRSRSDPPLTVLSEQEIVLQSGRPGWRYEVESMGRSLSLVAEVNERAVVLTCFGEFAPFDEVAVTLGAADEASALIATIEAQDSLPTGEAVNVTYTLTNVSSEGLYVLKWFTPLEGLAGDLFWVRRDGVGMEYRGKLVKRGPPTAEDYVWIDAGGSISAEVDLVEGYDFARAGEYTLQFRSPRLSHIAKTPGEQAGSFDLLGLIPIPCSPIRVTIGGS